MSNVSTSVRMMAFAMTLFTGSCAFDESADIDFAAAESAAFRLTTLRLLDPHAYIYATRRYGCQDVTAQAPAGASGVNQTIFGHMNEQSGNALANASVLALFPSFDPTAEESEVKIASARCAAGPDGRSCSLEDKGMSVTLKARQSQKECLPVLPQTVRPYDGGPTPPTGPCFEAGPFEIPLDYFLGLDGTLTDSYIAAQYENGQLKGGLVRGFLSTTEAARESMHLHRAIGWKTVGDMLPSGNQSCPPGNDLDYGPDKALGWYLYLNMTTERVAVAE